jgi:putative AlgH/UPF0301 family transcriptional regulator
MKVGRKTGMHDEGSGDGAAGRRPSGQSKAGQSRLHSRRTAKRGYLDGQMLIAMPSMGDERFARSVIYVCAHSGDGAMGIIVNQPAAHISFPDLLVQLDVVPAADLIQLPGRAVKVLKGGPVDTQRGFVLHSSDFFIENSTLPIDDGPPSTSSRRSRAATDRRAPSSHSAMPAGPLGSWRTRSSTTAGCIVRPTAI